MTIEDVHCTMYTSGRVSCGRSKIGIVWWVLEPVVTRLLVAELVGRGYLKLVDVLAVSLLLIAS